MTSEVRRQLLGGAAASLALAGLPALAQTAASSRTTRLIVPFPPGGPVDLTGRLLAQKLTDLWGRQVMVENKAGAGGIVGAEYAAKAAPDGNTFFLCSIHHSVLPSLKPKLSYDIERDFMPVSGGAMFPVILVAHPSLPVQSVSELIAYAKKNPKSLAYASAGNGGGTHLSAELFNMLAGTTLNHIPYKGSAPAMTDVLGGQVPLMFSDAPTALPFIRNGKVKALAVASTQRYSLMPDLPTMAESGLPGYEAYSWAAVVAPAGTPKDIVNQVSKDIVKVLSLPETRQRFHEAGADPFPTTPEGFAKILRSEIEKWQRVVKAANIQAD
jgi:tripartite-type tricarboxylate transporter receptor subunit TctC